MADIHVLEGTKTGSSYTYTLVFHIPVPEGTNAVGIPWSTVVKAVHGSPVASRCSKISSTEQDQLDSGLMIEKVVSIRLNPDKGDKVLDDVKKLYNKVKEEVLRDLAKMYKYYGLEMSATS